eukprot:CAMPEP_0168187310 /NCGR_PEP_ID=MMETSP0139_2-20121125/14955_1 /TAXON_ID=44445 /ORGANISM="Pseudo-nitzschia australis, Strain 10249 10 AB" /LENGTH=41 /DNA_ID= /DNA_START= /DNA_END= /DNA_ORIENTATION=
MTRLTRLIRTDIYDTTQTIDYLVRLIRYDHTRYESYDPHMH